MRHFLSALLILALPGGLYVLGRAQQARFQQLTASQSAASVLATTEVESPGDRERKLTQAIAESESPLFLGTASDQVAQVKKLIRAQPSTAEGAARRQAIYAVAVERWPHLFEGMQPGDLGVAAPASAAQAAAPRPRAPEELFKEAEADRLAHRDLAAEEYLAAEQAWQASSTPWASYLALEGLGKLRHYQQHLPEALDLFRRSLALQRQHLSDGTQHVTVTLGLLGRASRDQDKVDPESHAFAAAVELTESILDQAIRSLPLEHPEVAQLRLTLAELSLEQGDETRAILFYRAGLAFRAFTDDADQKAVVPAQLALGRLLSKRGEYASAIEAFKGAQKLILARDTDQGLVFEVDLALARAYLQSGPNSPHDGEALRLLLDVDNYYGGQVTPFEVRMDQQLLLVQALLRNGTDNRDLADRTLQQVESILPHVGTPELAERTHRLRAEYFRRKPAVQVHKRRAP